MSKGRSLKSCVALAVFCCSLLLACISPACAETTSGDPNSFAIYSSFSGGPVPTSGTSPCIIPASGHHLFYSFKPSNGTSISLRPYVHVPEIVPVSYNRTFVLNLGFQGTSLNCTVSNVVSAGTVFWYQSSYVKQEFRNGVWAAYQSTMTPNGFTQFYKAIIPAYATAVAFSATDKFNFTANGNSVGLVSFGGYVVNSDDQSVVDIVNDILTQVKQINSNSSSALSVLNSILAQCKALNADTDTIITILNAVKSQIVALNGKVDDIYTLLKDSLKAETAALDKKSSEIGEQIMQRVDSEQYWSDKNTEAFNAIDMVNWSFGSGVVGTLPTVSNLFKGLWDSFGDAVLLFTFPLMLGLALVIIGRISRHSGKGGKDGGDSV